MSVEDEAHGKKQIAGPVAVPPRGGLDCCTATPRLRQPYEPPPEMTGPGVTLPGSSQNWHPKAYGSPASGSGHPGTFLKSSTSSSNEIIFVYTYR
jgi:hypothetical protein